MTRRGQKIASVVLLVIAVASGVAAVYLSYESGCAGDLKTGALGDPQLAMQIGNKANGTLLLAMLIGSSAFLVWPSFIVSRRIKHAASWFFASAIALWASSFQAATAGTQACFPPQQGAAPEVGYAASGELGRWT